MTERDEKLLRSRWRSKRSRMCKEWRDSFEAFRAWCLERDWDPSAWILAAGPVMGPETTVLKKTATAKGGPLVDGYDPIPGYSHRPCLTCGIQEDRCSNVCWMYEIHLDATLARAREIANRPTKRGRHR